MVGLSDLWSTVNRAAKAMPLSRHHPTPVYDFISRLGVHVPAHLSSWQPPRTPFSSSTQVFPAVALYLILVLGGRELMKGRRPIAEKYVALPFLIHNLALSIGSGVLLVLVAEEIGPLVWEKGLWFGICSPGAWTSRLETFYIVNYYFKGWEWLDTLFLVVKKKPLAFLHVYHHAATAILCFSQLQGHTSVSWVVISLNLAVHVIMYFYYALSSLKIRVPWKRWVTVFQVVQFLIDLVVIWFALYNYVAYNYFPRLPHLGNCHGTEMAAFCGTAVITSYLVLFIAFYRKTYARSQPGQPIETAKKALVAAASAPNGFLSQVGADTNGKVNGKSQ